jgi:hypothetical protein
MTKSTGKQSKLRWVRAISDYRSDIHLKRHQAIQFLRPRILLLSIAICIAGIVNIVIIGKGHDLSKSDWASWVQAIGSILAVMIATVAVVYQRSNEALKNEEIQRQRDRRIILAYHSLLMHIAETCGQITKLVSPTYKSWEFQGIVLDEARELLRSIQFSDYPDYALVRRSLHVQHLLHISSAIIRLMPGSETDDEDREALRGTLRKTFEEALVALTQSTEVLVRISTQDELDKDRIISRNLDQHRNRTKDLYEQVLSESGISAQRTQPQPHNEIPQNGDQPAPTSI